MKITTIIITATIITLFILVGMWLSNIKMTTQQRPIIELVNQEREEADSCHYKKWIN